MRNSLLWVTNSMWIGQHAQGWRQRRALMENHRLRRDGFAPTSSFRLRAGTWDRHTRTP
jgi:hypothetical protein